MLRLLISSLDRWTRRQDEWEPELPWWTACIYGVGLAVLLNIYVIHPWVWSLYD
jgi:hypothetical protein